MDVQNPAPRLRKSLRRVTDTAHSAFRRRAAVATATDGCRVCQSEDLEHRTVHSVTNPKKDPRELWICGSCGHVSIPGNRKDYRERNYDEFAGGSRIGLDGQPGREFHMANLGLNALDRDDVEVLLYGVGASQDNHHIANLPNVAQVAIGDIMQVRDDAEFVDLNESPTRRFPLVIASEVVEHFRDPRPDFAHMADFVSRHGLLICGTNVYDGGNLAKDPYIFYPDHSSYYSPQALALLARDNGLHIDFRMPVIGGGLRKRYVLLTRSRAVLDRVAIYFGSHAYAPSETRLRLRSHDPVAAKKQAQAGRKTS